MIFRILDSNKPGTFLLLAGVGLVTFWWLLAIIVPVATVNLWAWAIPATVLLAGITHLIARPIIRDHLGLDPLG